MAPINPLKRLRLEAQLTVAQVSALGGGSRIFILNAESGLYTEPPPRLFNVLDSEHPHPLDLTTITEEYREWQRDTRQFNYGVLSPFWLTASTAHYYPTEGHPLAAWRTFSGITSRIRPAKLYCIHPGVLTRFELKPWEVASIPSGILDALTESGYDEQMLAVLAQRWVDYKEHLSTTVASVGTSEPHEQGLGLL